MKKKGLLSIALLLFVTIVFFACKKTPTDPKPTDTGFDKTKMLTTYADELIIPAYKTMQERMNLLKELSDAFVAAPNVGTQLGMKAGFEETYQQYERVAAFQFGPAETALLDIYLNYSGGLDYSFATAGGATGFSVDTAAIESNIASGNYDLTKVTRSNLYSQGFPALSYLYFAPGAVEKFSNNTANRVKYVNDLVARIKTLVDGVANDWSGYRTTFISNTQTNSGSPIANIVNQLAYQMDMMKGPRIGWPLGKQSNGIVFATKCEGYYADISADLAEENLMALKKVYTTGIAGYLISLKKESLNNDVIAQFDVAIEKLKNVPEPMSDVLTSQPATVETAYKEIQKLLTLLKTDVASATAVQISYTDNDGD